MNTLELLPYSVSGLAGTSALRPALRAGIDGSGKPLANLDRPGRRRRSAFTIRIADSGLRPFRVR
jgi:hypothetical protein